MEQAVSKRALILGIAGQDGSFLADILLEQGFEVHGFYRRTSNSITLPRVEHLRDRITLHQGDVTDYASLDRVVRDVAPHWVLNEADQDHVGFSHATPLYSVQVTYGGVANLLEVVRRWQESPRQAGTAPRIFQPCSATMFDPKQNAKGDWRSKDYEEWMPCDELTCVKPMSPYACAKTAAYALCGFYRQQHGLHVVCGILFNHDSPRRGGDYLLQKIAREAKLVAAGKLDAVTVGSLDLKVDIGYAREFMAGAVKLMELPEAGDYVLGTGKAVRIGDLVADALYAAGVESVRGFIPQGYVKVDPAFRPGKMVELIADCAKARAAIGWEPKWDALRVLRLLMEKEEG